MIHVLIDEITPCLKDVKSGEIVNTEVIRIKRKSFLEKYNKRNGWYINWAELVVKNEVYALVLHGTVDIQGLVALRKDDEMKAVYITWMCASPENNALLSDNPRFRGVGGHLFAIAMAKSKDYGYDGYVYGFAANQTLLEHYINTFSAEHIGILHPYQFAVDDKAAEEVLEVYEYDWVDEEI